MEREREQGSEPACERARLRASKAIAREGALSPRRPRAGRARRGGRCASPEPRRRRPERSRDATADGSEKRESQASAGEDCPQRPSGLERLELANCAMTGGEGSPCTRFRMPLGRWAPRCRCTPARRRTSDEERVWRQYTDDETSTASNVHRKCEGGWMRVRRP
eukprot:4743931-Pleurochrysis_carterae.AAC.2